MVGRNKGTVVACLFLAGLLFFVAIRNKINLDSAGLRYLGAFGGCSDSLIIEVCSLVGGIAISPDYPPWGGLAYTPFTAGDGETTSASSLAENKPPQDLFKAIKAPNITCQGHEIYVAVIAHYEENRTSILVSDCYFI